MKATPRNVARLSRRVEALTQSLGPAQPTGLTDAEALAIGLELAGWQVLGWTDGRRADDPPLFDLRRWLREDETPTPDYTPDARVNCWPKETNA